MSTPKQLPKYVCHKEVQALKIVKVERLSQKNCSLLLFAEAGYEPIEVPNDWIDRFGPTRGGYYVVYKDGYTSFSPARAFEEGYTAVTE